MINIKNKLIVYNIIFFIILGLTSNLYAEQENFFVKLKSFVFDEKEEYTIEEIVSETKEINEDVKDLTDDYIIKTVKKYNELISDMRTEVNSKSWYIFDRDDQDKFELMLKGIKKISDMYQKLDEEKNKVRKNMKGYIKNVKIFHINIKKIQRNEKTEKSRMENELKYLGSGENEDIKRKSLTQRIEFADKRIKMINKFSNNYKKIPPVLHEAEGYIEKFIFIIEQSAAVYKDAYKTLKLQKDINNAYRTINELKNLNFLSDNIMKSWEDLDSIVTSLTNQIENISQ